MRPKKIIKFVPGKSAAKVVKAGSLWPPIRLEMVDDPALGGIW